MKRNGFISLSIIVLATFAFSSCVVYHPQNVDIPLLNEKGDCHIDASFSMSAPLLAAPAINATVSYAPLNHIGAQVAANFTEVGTYQLQGAVGTFFPNGKSVLECYFGVGHGAAEDDTVSDLYEETYRVGGDYNMVFSQINFGWVGLGDGFFDIGVGLKGGLLFSNFNKTQYNADGTQTIVESLNAQHFLLQPQLMLRFGFNNFKFSINVAYAALSDWPTENNYFNYDRFSAGLGMHFDL